jgi:hypothetical protein
VPKPPDSGLSRVLGALGKLSERQRPGWPGTTPATNGTNGTMNSARTRAAVGIAVAVAVIAAIVAIALAGGGGGSASTSSTDASKGSPRSAAKFAGDLAIAAAYLGIPRAQLRRDLRSGRTMVQVAVDTSGKTVAGLIQALIDAKAPRLAARPTGTRATGANASARLGRLRTRVTAEVNRSRTRAPGPPRVVGDLSAASAYLGVSRAALHKDLLAGQTLAQLAATTPGRTTAGLISALVAAREAKLASEVSAGRLTAAQARASRSTLHRRVTAEVNRAARKRTSKAGGRGDTGEATARGEAGEAAAGLEGAEGGPEAAEGS